MYNRYDVDFAHLSVIHFLFFARITKLLLQFVRAIYPVSKKPRSETLDAVKSEETRSETEVYSGKENIV